MKKGRYGVDNPLETNLIVPFWQEGIYLSMLSCCNALAPCVMVLPNSRHFHASLFQGGEQNL
jgi:hypothetical protein